MSRKVSGPHSSQPAQSVWDRHQQRLASASHSAGFGPQFGFAAATVAGFTAWAAASATLPHDAVMPVVATLFLTFAGTFAVIAWMRGWMDPNGVTYRDVAGVLTLIGICAAATIDSEQMMRLVQGRETE